MLHLGLSFRTVLPWAPLWNVAVSLSLSLSLFLTLFLPQRCTPIVHISHDFCMSPHVSSLISLFSNRKHTHFLICSLWFLVKKCSRSVGSLEDAHSPGALGGDVRKLRRIASSSFYIYATSYATSYGISMVYGIPMDPMVCLLLSFPMVLTILGIWWVFEIWFQTARSCAEKLPAGIPRRCSSCDACRRRVAVPRDDLTRSQSQDIQDVPSGCNTLQYVAR